jgi:hypothetical protein
MVVIFKKKIPNAEREELITCNGIHVNMSTETKPKNHTVIPWYQWGLIPRPPVDTKSKDAQISYINDIVFAYNLHIFPPCALNYL